MNRPLLAGLFAIAALTPLSSALAQSQSHGAMSMQDHASMPGMAAANAVTTSPADNAMLAAAPTEFSVSFPHAMTLKTLKLSSDAGQTVDVEVGPTTSPATTVTAPLPTLAQGSYSAAWSATGADGQEMTGVVRFMVH